MRKAKFLLGGTFVAAVVAAVFAFNVNAGFRAATTIYTHSATDPLTLCTVPREGITTTNAGPAQILATFDSAKPCELVFTKTTD